PRGLRARRRLQRAPEHHERRDAARRTAVPATVARRAPRYDLARPLFARALARLDETPADRTSADAAPAVACGVARAGPLGAGPSSSRARANTRSNMASVNRPVWVL